MKLTSQVDSERLKKLLPPLREFSSIAGVRVKCGEQIYIRFCGDDFLGYSQDKRIMQAAIEGIEREGVFHSATPDSAGYLNCYSRLEKILSRFYGTEDCIVYNSHLSGICGILSASTSELKYLFCDEKCSQHIKNACKLQQAELTEFAHLDLLDLEKCLRECEDTTKAIIIIESVLEKTGALIEVNDYLKIANSYKTRLVVDETWAVGVLGIIGSGAVENANLTGEIFAQIVGFEGALCGVGSAVCASAVITSLQRQCSLEYSTQIPVSPNNAYAVEEVVKQIQIEAPRRARNRLNTQHVRSELKRLGLKVSGSPGIPFMEVYFEDKHKAVKVINGLFQRGFLVAPVFTCRSTAEVCGIRITIMFEHSDEEIADFLQAFSDVLGRVGIC